MFHCKDPVSASCQMWLMAVAKDVSSSLSDIPTDGEGSEMPTTLLRAPSRGSDAVELSLRSADDGEIVHIPPWMLTPSLMADTQPFRRFRSYKGQQHYSGTYWSSTESSHVIYESRLELSRLMIADFDPTVERIFAQPLMIRARIDERARRHIPDYLLIRGADLTFVAVKPRDRPRMAAW